MPRILDRLKLVVDLLLRVAGLVVDALRACGKRSARAVRQALAWFRDAVGAGAREACKRTLVLAATALRKPVEAVRLRAVLVRFEQLIGWRLGGASMSESHVSAA